MAQHPAERAPGRVSFPSSNEFQIELRRRVHEDLQRTGRRSRDNPEMFVKAGVILSAFVLFYGALVFLPVDWWLALALAAGLGISAAAIGFNIMHDGGHGAFSRRPWLNKLAAMTLDAIGGSSYIWHWKHGIYHHTYTNIAGHDSDIDLGVLGRLSPHQPRRAFHRWQQWYMWPLYGLMTVRWHLYDDFHDLLRAKIGTHPFPRPTGWDVAVFAGGKVVFFALAFGLPILFHPVWVVAVYYGVASVVMGILMSSVFQMAHCVEGAAFPVPERGSGSMAQAWAIHQVETTCDFIRQNRFAAWFLGGLNFQIEHHLFPRICHVNYPAISKIVEATCREFGVRYAEHRTLWAGLRSHFRWLRAMGASPAAG